MKQKILISVIIVTYNCLDYLKKCIHSIYEYNDIGKSLQIIIVDNGNDFATTENWIKTKYKSIVYIKNDNKGFGNGNNVGFKYATGKYLIFLNPDTELVEPIFKYAIEKFESDDKLGLFGLRLINEKFDDNKSFGGRNNYGIIRTLFVNFLIKFKIFIPKIMYTCGADIFVTRIAFLKAGKFDENIFMYFEETDLINRINELQLYNSYFKDKKIIHYEGKCSSQNLYNYYKKMFASKIYVTEKYNANVKKMIDYEKKYCSYKYILNKILGNHEIALEYKKIISYLRNI